MSFDDYDDVPDEDARAREDAADEDRELYVPECSDGLCGATDCPRCSETMP